MNASIFRTAEGKILDLTQRCRCCEGDYTFYPLVEKMACVNPECSAFGIEFTIPYKEDPVVVKKHKKKYVVGVVKNEK